jgi:hypothetical protein
MATKNQVRANQLNALHSTGPRTEVGKRAVRRNALRHGILSTDVVLPDESNKAFLQFKREFWDYLKPVGPVEEEELSKLANFGWRLRRCAKIDTGTFENNQDQKICMNRLALAFAGGSVQFSSLTRYEGHLSRQYVITLRELERLQHKRAGQAISPPVAADIDIGLTLQEQVCDALEDFKARQDESDRLKTEVKQLLPKGKKSNSKRRNGASDD